MPTAAPAGGGADATGDAADDDTPLDLPAIVRACCDAFDDLDGGSDDGEDGSGSGGAGDESGAGGGGGARGRRAFARDVFMIGEWFVENSELMAQFLALYMEQCEQYGLRVCAAVSFWIRHFPSQFDAHPPLCALVNRLRAAAARDQRVDDTLREELDISSVPSYAWLRNVSVRNPVSRHSSLCFEQWSPVDLANALGYIDYRVLSRVTISEVKKYVKLSKLRETPILERSIAVFNSISCWVQCMILSKSSPNERADVITKFVNVGKHLRRLANFNTLMAVVGGVTHSSIGRLAKTQALLSAQVKKDLGEMAQLLSTANNFAHYRRALREARGYSARIPIMGIHLKDLIAWCNKNNADQFERTARVSRRRVRQLANLLGYFIGVRRIAASLLPDPNMDLINTLKVSFDINYNENDIYDLSVKREPRTSRGTGSGGGGSSNNAGGGGGSSSASTPSGDTPPVVFADWASGVCQTPDPDTVNKHISAMVDAVFKHYDHDRNEYISRAEFEQIAGNFPYNLDSFVTIDADRDGQISKSEMKAYFLELNKRSAELRSGFRHNFQETTFLTPTVCSHCKKLLWGLIRQGLKCRDCALVVHDACKRLAIAECRRVAAALPAPALVGRRRTQSGGSDDGATGGATAAAAAAGTAAVVGVNASGANFIANAAAAAAATPRGTGGGGGSAPSSSGIAMGGLYDWLVNASPHHHHHGGGSSGGGHASRRPHNSSSSGFGSDSSPAETVDQPVAVSGEIAVSGENSHATANGSARPRPASVSSPKPATRRGASPLAIAAGESPLFRHRAPATSGATERLTPTDHPAVARLLVDEAGGSAGDAPSSPANLSAMAAEGLSGVRTVFRSSFHRLLRSSKKYRSASETTGDYSSGGVSPSRGPKGGSPSLDDGRTPVGGGVPLAAVVARQQADPPGRITPRRQASLASEEVFCEDDGTGPVASPAPTARTPRTRPAAILSEGGGHGADSAEDRLRRKIESLTRSNEKLRENFRRNSASLSPLDGAARALSASLPNR